MAKKTTISLIVTVKNEAESIVALLESMASQTLLPNEIVIVDGESVDDTPKLIEKFAKSHPKLDLQLICQPSNRSQGRNLAVAKAKGEVLAITDAGCRLDSCWLEELMKVYDEKLVPAVAGYYAGDAKTEFEQAAVSFFLVMPDKVNPDDFLPATRSMLIKKSLWQELGGLREDLKAAEDYEFALRLRKLLQFRGQKIGFAHRAVAYWRPPKDWRQFLGMVGEQLLSLKKFVSDAVFVKRTVFTTLAIIRFAFVVPTNR